MSIIAMMTIVAVADIIIATLIIPISIAVMVIIIITIREMKIIVNVKKEILNTIIITMGSILLPTMNAVLKSPKKNF